MTEDPPPRPRIAVVSAHDTDLVARLATLAHHPVVQRFRDLYADAPAIRQFGASALLVELAEIGLEDAGALRMVRSLLPDLGIVVVCDLPNEVAGRDLAARIGASVLVEPCPTRRLTSVVDAVLVASARTETETLLDLVRGISDEINNPLLFVGGHLQLLRRSLHGDPGKLDQLQPVQNGFERIAQTMRKLRLLTRAGDTAPGGETVDMGDLARALAQRSATAGAVVLDAPPLQGAAVVRGDAELLQYMLEHLWQAAAALAHGGTTAAIAVTPTQAAVAVRACIDAQRLPAWQLPRAFEPYYLTRILRGTPHGLSLFLVQVIAHSHGGRALARWAADGSLLLEIELAREGR